LHARSLAPALLSESSMTRPLVAPAIQACNDDFDDCTQARASCRATLRGRAGAH